MGFLDNSGDIILDAVLTDHGRKVLAKGTGDFEITKFSLGDEEIDYSLYDTTNVNGSAYYDLEILQTPILEAFTDNAISMKSKLVTFDSLELLYLPVIKINQISASPSNTKMHSSGSFIIAVDSTTENDGTNANGTNGIGYDSAGNPVSGILFGSTTSQGGSILVDQGLDTAAKAPSETLDPGLYESSYTIQLDSRLGKISNATTGINITSDYIDDDFIEYYTITTDDGLAYNNTSTVPAGQVIQGPRGSSLNFKISSTDNLRDSNFLFEQLGSTSRLDNKAGTSSLVYHIDTLIRVTGINTGYTIDIPARFVKFKSL